MPDLEELLDEVKDMNSFFEFVRALIKDREVSAQYEQNNPFGYWENVTIESYLDAALSWAETTRMGKTQGENGEPSWRTFAEFLYTGKIYE